MANNRKGAVADQTRVDILSTIPDADDVRDKLVPNATLLTAGAKRLSDRKTIFALLSSREMAKVGNTPTLDKEVSTIPAATLKRIRAAYQMSSPAMRKEIEDGLNEYYRDNIDEAKGKVTIMPGAFTGIGTDKGVNSKILYAETEIAGAAKANVAAAPAKAKIVPTKVMAFKETAIKGTVVRAGGAAKGAVAGAAYNEDERTLMHLAAVIGEPISVAGKTFSPDIYKAYVMKYLGPKNIEKVREEFSKEADRKALYQFLYINGAWAGAYEKLKVILNDKEPVNSLKDTVALYARRGTTAYGMFANQSYNGGVAKYGINYLAVGAEPAANTAVQASKIVPTAIAKGARLEGNRITVDFGEAFGERRNKSVLKLELDSRPSAMRQSELLSSKASKVYEFAMGDKTLYLSVGKRGGNVDVTVTLRPKKEKADISETKRFSLTVDSNGLADVSKASQLVHAGLGVKSVTVENEGKKTVQATSVKEAKKAVAAAERKAKDRAREKG
jgi:hypothetical protein